METSGNNRGVEPGEGEESLQTMIAGVTPVKETGKEERTGRNSLELYNSKKGMVKSIPVKLSYLERPTSHSMGSL